MQCVQVEASFEQCWTVPFTKRLEAVRVSDFKSCADVYRNPYCNLLSQEQDKISLIGSC